MGEGYLFVGLDKSETGAKSATFTAPIAAAGRYDVRMSYSANGNRSASVPVTVSGMTGKEPPTLHVDQKKRPPIDGLFISLGTYEFAAGAKATVRISNEGTTGVVIVDAIQIVPVTGER